MLDIVGIGMACLDVLVRVKDMPTWEGGTRLHGLALQGGGPVGTALAAAAKLGANTGFIGTYGSDRLGAIKLQTLQDDGIDLSHAVKMDGPENQVILVSVHAETGERVFSGMGSTDRFTLKPEQLDRDYITQARFLHLDGYHVEAALQAARWMQAAGKPVMLDGSATNSPVGKAMRTLVEQCDVLICGSGFGPALTGCADLWKAGEAIIKMGPRIAVQTEGKAGSYTVTPEERFHTPAFDVDVVDTTGAGDVFHGAFLVGLLHGWEVRKVAEFASAVAAIKCTRLGGRSGIPTMEEALAFIQARSQRNAKISP